MGAKMPQFLDTAADHIFGQNVLLKSTITGKPSNRSKNIQVEKPEQLDAHLMQRMRDSIYFLMSTFFVVTLLFRFSFLPCSHRLKLFYSFPFPSVLLLLLKSAIFKHWLYTSVHACFLSTVKRDYHLGRLEYYLGRRIASIKNNVNGYQKRKSGSKQVSRDGASDGGNGHVGAGAGSSDGNGVPIDNEDTGDEGNHGKNDQSHENIEVEDEEEILIKLRKDVESENDKNDEEDKDGDSKDQVENEEEEEEEGDKSSLNSGDDDELLKLNKYDDFKNDSLFNDSYDSDDSRLFIADDE
ncbi:uncharacterized protein LOC123272710 isoform X2 [Cotesia glomerata]|nr:uncharacterized protein LOC123272710 isoform X2 [Cotesia glomerata]